jgi:AraC-like DNA-binding protein
MSETRLLLRTVAVEGFPRVLDMGYVRGSPGHAERLLDFWVLGIVISGHIGIEVGSERFSAGPEEYYLLPARTHHRGLDASPFDCIFFHFQLRPGHGTPKYELALKGETLPEVNYVGLCSFLDRQFRTGIADGDQLGLQLLALLGQLALVQLRRSALLAEPSKALAAAVLELVRSEYAAPLNSAAISARLGYSYAYLEKVFRSSYNRSIHQELLQARVQAAALELGMGKPMKQIAKDVGFSDYYYFLKVFKRVRGVSPGAFRASHVQAAATRAMDR